MKVTRESGFTLTEMLAVLAIIAFIAGMGYVGVNALNKDSGTQEHVSNAKSVEDAVHMYYRDNGVLPTSEEVTDITEDSKEVMRSELLKAGVPDAKEVVDKLIADGKVRKIDFNKLGDYSDIRESDPGVDELVIIEEYPASELGTYQNDISGFVFSVNTDKSSSGTQYSGAHKLESVEDLDQIENNLADSVFTDASELKPYGFQVVDIEENADETVDVTVGWTKQFVDTEGNAVRGYLAGNYKVSIQETGDTKTVGGDVVEHTFTSVKEDVINMKLRGLNLVYNEEDSLAGSTREASIDGVDVTVELPDSNNGGSVDVNDDVDEVVDGEQEKNKNKLYDVLKGKEGFNKNNVIAVENGFKITGIRGGDRVVMKEVRKDGSEYVRDENRTYLFKVKDGNNAILIPKDPYLQEDFQTNPDSNYEYVIEAYENALCSSDCGEGNFDSVVSVYYE